MTSSPYDPAPSWMLEEINRLAESRLEAQLTTALAADQRALTFASFIATLEAAAIGIVATVQLSGSPLLAMMVIVVGFGCATALAVWSAMPERWYSPGYRPGLWIADLSDPGTLDDRRRELIEHYDVMIIDNEAAMASNARQLKLALLSVLASLLIAGVLVSGVLG